jgi:hypothetical protein
VYGESGYFEGEERSGRSEVATTEGMPNSSLLFFKRGFASATTEGMLNS